MSDETLQMTEDQVPLDGLPETTEDLVEFYGGRVVTSAERSIRFTLPARRGVAASGDIACTLTWEETEPGVGTLRILADEDTSVGKRSRVALLVVGTIGALLWTAFFFAPSLGPLAMIGGVLAFATYFLALRRKPGGVAADFLRRLAKAQGEGEDSSVPPEVE